MKNILFLFFFILTFAVRAQQWEWGRQHSWSTDNDPRSIASDKSQNVIVCGEHYNGVYPPSGFIIKYDKFGNKLWDINIADSPVILKDIITDSNENIYVAGSFECSVNFMGTPLVSGGSQDILLVKISSDGELKWVKTSDTAGQERMNSLTIDANDHIFATGNFRDSLFFSTPTIVSPSCNLFIACIDTSGQFLWIKTSTILDSNSTYSGAVGEGIILDPNGNIFVVSAINGSIKLDTAIIDDGISTRILKLDSVGNFIWSKNISNGFNDYSLRLKPTVDFVYIIKSTYSGRVLQKYDQLGVFIWQKPIGTSDIFQSYNYSVYLSEFLDTIGCKITSVDCLSGVCDSFLVNHTGSEMCSFNGGYYFTGSFYQGNTLECGNDILTSSIGYTFYVAKFSTNNQTVEITHNKKSSLNLFPNPTSGQLIIEFQKNIQKTEIFIYDVLGNSFFNRVSRNSDFEKINLTSLPKGIYFMEIVSDGEREVKEIVLR